VTTSEKRAGVSEITVDSQDIVRDLDGYQQGDVIGHVEGLMISTATGWDLEATPLGIGIVSQTCDVVLTTRTSVLVGKIVTLEGDEKRQAEDGKKPRYVRLPQAPGMFIDLDVVATLDKARVRSAERTHAMPEAAVEIRKVGKAIGRRFSRFPFPDAVVPWLTPLRETFIRKYDKSNSPLGRALAAVDEFRVHCDKWDAGPPYSLTLIVVLHTGVLPTFADDEIPDLSPELDKWLRTPQGELRQSAGLIAGKLFPEKGTPPPAADRYHLWMALADVWANTMKPSAKDLAEVPGAATAVADSVFGADVTDEDELTLNRVKQSEYLDVEHLSEPRL
jgi:hypothetical protein